MIINFITSNQGKFEWAKRRLVGSNIKLVQKILNIKESRDIDVEDVVISKCLQAKHLIKEPFIIDDSGFYITALNKFPATHIKFILQTIGIKGILKLMENQNNREAIFVSALMFHEGENEKIFICRDIGKISLKAVGKNLHGFNDVMKIFIPKGFKKTVAEMSDLEFAKYEATIEKIDHYHQFRKYYKNFFN